MGVYIDPTDMTKEHWLNLYASGKAMITAPFDSIDQKTHVFVCLVQNPGFTAAGVLYDVREFNRWLRRPIDDGRPKTLYIVRREFLTVDVVGQIGYSVLQGDYD